MKCRIVVADDNKDSADTLVLLLQFDGHEVEVAHDGRKALEIIERYEPHAALLDIAMPGLDGYEVARRIRASPQGADMMLVALTGWGQMGDKLRALSAGFDHHLVKPFEQTAVQSILAQLPCDTAA